MNIQIQTYTVYEKNRVCGLFETFGALCADTQVGWRRSEAGLQVRHPFILILILNHHNYNQHHKGRVKKWKFKMAFAMKGGEGGLAYHKSF